VSIDRYLGRRWSPAYDCLAFAAEVWRDLTGEDLRGRLDGLFVPAAQREPALRHFRAFERLLEPLDPCLVLMRRPRSEPHLGVYIRGKVLHLDGAGAKHVLLGLTALSFPRLEFFR
jgi:hypothetical protein